MHLLTKRREDLVAIRAQTLNRLHQLPADLIPAGAPRNLSAAGAAAMLRQARPSGVPAVTRRQLAADLIADARSLDRRIKAVEERITAAITQSKTSLVELFGVNPVLAAKLLGEVRDVRRFPTKYHFAAHTGTACGATAEGPDGRRVLAVSTDEHLGVPAVRGLADAVEGRAVTSACWASPLIRPREEIPPGSWLLHEPHTEEEAAARAEALELLPEGRQP